jgi:hypothetical protein
LNNEYEIMAAIIRSCHRVMLSSCHTHSIKQSPSLYRVRHRKTLSLSTRSHLGRYLPASTIKIHNLVGGTDLDLCFFLLGLYCTNRESKPVTDQVSSISTPIFVYMARILYTHICTYMTHTPASTHQPPHPARVKARHDCNIGAIDHLCLLASFFHVTLLGSLYRVCIYQHARICTVGT